MLPFDVLVSAHRQLSFTLETPWNSVLRCSRLWQQNHVIEMLRIRTAELGGKTG
jgi:hypothetical protein